MFLREMSCKFTIPALNYLGNSSGLSMLNKYNITYFIAQQQMKYSKLKQHLNVIHQV